MNVTDQYTYRITWSPDDGEHLGLCVEFPSPSRLAPIPAKALSGIQRLVRSVLADVQANGETPPEPLATVGTAASSWCGCHPKRTVGLRYRPQKPASA